MSGVEQGRARSRSRGKYTTGLDSYSLRAYFSQTELLAQPGELAIHKMLDPINVFVFEVTRGTPQLCSGLTFLERVFTKSIVG